MTSGQVRLAQDDVRGVGEEKAKILHEVRALRPLARFAAFAAQNEDLVCVTVWRGQGIAGEDKVLQVFSFSCQVFRLSRPVAVCTLCCAPRWRRIPRQ